MTFEIIPHAEASVITLVNSINRVIINPIIIFVFAVAMVYFLYGLVQYLISPDDEKIRTTSKQHMLWGIIGLFIMVAVFAIMNIILRTVGENKVKIGNDGTFGVEKVKISNDGSLK